MAPVDWSLGSSGCIPLALGEVVLVDGGHAPIHDEAERRGQEAMAFLSSCR